MENDDVINDAGEHALDGERTIPSVSARRRPAFAIIGVVAVILALAFTLFIYAHQSDRKAVVEEQRAAAKAEREKDKTLGKHLPKIDFASVAAADPVQPDAPAVTDAATGAPPLPEDAGGSRAQRDKSHRYAERLEREAERERRKAAALAQKRLEASPLAYSQKQSRLGGAADNEARSLAAQYQDVAEGGEPGAESDGLSTRLKPTRVQGTRAAVLPHPNFMLTKGHFLDCALEQAINSTLAGMLSCRLSNDVYSTNGKVVLLERGTRLTGEYQRGLMKGQARLFVLWTRAETPNYVVVDLDSPGTDGLGRAGVDGYVNHHFWDRFGSAIMLSLIDDIGQYAVAKAQEGNANQIQLGGTASAAEDMAAEALKYSINIPPTLERNQGGYVSIFVARDLDFSDVYTLASN
jgi:type IV secretion system protein VirB10